MLGRARQVKDDELGLVRFVHDGLVQPHGRVHATNVGRLPVVIKYDKITIKSAVMSRTKLTTSKRNPRSPQKVDFKLKFG